MLLARLPKLLVRYRTHAAILAMLVLLACFIGISLALKTPALSKYDLWFTTEAQERRNDEIRTAMIGFTMLGNTVTLLIVALSTTIYFASRKLFHAGGFAFLSLIGLPIDEALKALFARPRPGADLVQILIPRTGYSFPSGHALGSTAVYGFLAFLAWVHLRDYKARKPIAFALACLPPLISLSRVYVGAHWLSDVVGGMAMGLIVVILLALVYSRTAPAARPVPPASTPSPQAPSSPNSLSP